MKKWLFSRWRGWRPIKRLINKIASGCCPYYVYHPAGWIV
ncbi:hypothetical protein DCCM_0040 [Desulfocucumis palustris]|uniref:Uncharacterized protein n=1 Tax=Desulfocucumis palustris TaxID=1898651 RepID=A0A2L2XCA6_9FIRM|nr:hypothetical protein DCCM_0040 [Desulfocucumis palustris]